ncbi:LacI family DNA-binding transcriptional regulator [Cryptosporangium japonicum]|uniref:LacI family DNA-binding transcriptional regulator n=1 Tax=Cryptosporangium japonicum TaxID=80872 RepID=A0ABN0U0X9_9ACTN
MGTDTGRERPATLEDIAREAGVALSTASRVLERARTGGRVDTPKAIRVLEVAADLEYEPNLFAASLRTNRTYTLGVLVPRLTDIVLSTIYEGIDAGAADAGYQSVVANTMDDPRQQRLRAEKLLQRGVDALLFGDAQLDDPFLDELAARGVPFALFSRRHPRYPSATCDDYEGGRLAGNHLADLGHRDVAVLAGRPYASTGVDRTAGCLDALRERGITVAAHRIVHSGFDPEAGYVAARAMFAAGDGPTAVFVVNDMAAIGAMGALRDLGVAVGREVAVVGFNDISIAADVSPALTSIVSPLDTMGREAVRLVLDRVKAPGSPAARVLLPPRLVVRESSDPSAGTRRHPER